MYKYILDIDDIFLIVGHNFNERNCFDIDIIRKIAQDLAGKFMF